MKSLPDICIERQLPLDVIRNMIRRSPDLKKLGTRIGPTKGYTEEDGDHLCAAYAARTARRGRPRPQD